MENRNVILDSNLFIALYSPDDTLHNQAVLMMEGLKNICIIVPYCVIQEVTTVLTYKQGKKKADIFLEDLRRSGNLIIIDNDARLEIEFYLQFKEKLSFTDIALIHIAQKYNAILFTFDKQLLNLYKISI